MANTPNLPEGTDSIVEPGPVANGTTTEEPSRVNKAKQTIRDEVYGLRDSATGKARDYAQQGKEKTTTTLRDVSKALDDAATSVDDRLGEQYGEYARMAAGAVGNFAERIESKDVGELLKDAEDMVRKSPAVAIGLAAAVGFAIARVVKSGFDDVEKLARDRESRSDTDTGDTQTPE